MRLKQSISTLLFTALMSLTFVQCTSNNGQTKEEASLQIGSLPDLKVVDGRNVFGTNMILASADSKDTITVQVEYDAASGMTRFLDKKKRTICEGKVQRAGDVTLLVNEKGGNKDIFALKKSVGKLKGWAQKDAQAAKLKEVLSRADMKQYVSEKQGQVIFNPSSAEALATVYNTVLEEMPASYSFAERDLVSNILSNIGSGDLAAMAAAQAMSKANKPSIAPNPATTSFEITFPVDGSYKMKLISLKDGIMKEQSVLTGNMTVDVSNMAEGDYLVIVTDANSKNVLSEPLTVKR